MQHTSRDVKIGSSRDLAQLHLCAELLWGLGKQTIEKLIQLAEPDVEERSVDS